MLRASFAPTRLARLPLATSRTCTSPLSPSHLLPLRAAAKPLIVAQLFSTTAILAAADFDSAGEERQPHKPVAEKACHEPPSSTRRAPATTVVFHRLFYSTYFTDLTAENAPQDMDVGKQEDDEFESDEPYERDPPENAWEYHSIDSFATTPPSPKVRIELMSEVLPLVEDPNGVKVRQVFEAIVKHWDTEIPLSKYQERYLRKEHDIPADKKIGFTKRDNLDFLRHVKYNDEYLKKRTKFWAFVDDDGVPRFSLYNRGMAAGTHPDDFPQPVGDGPVSRLLASIPSEDKA
ncbi:hypothetical protein NBRC10513v2_003864 [Rhodotorula toruloides]|uniref:FGENESH: predicted gene_18.105 protein n=1 Tax=Rhodotorula toruloides TaxID=5286 RepID=A0A0K3CRF2_RHOTO|nr:hypothetical protein AAT19DRAFT_11888 [Rhodotorula toruloides]